MEQKNQRNSKRRLNSLILLVAFTAIMLIVSTYAWFSINKDVSITNLTGDVTVVEGLQISLDAKNWGKTIDLSKLNIKDTGASYPANTSNTNVQPTALSPVSTTGVVDPASDKLPMFKGTYDGNKSLTDITQIAAENAEAGYFAFDVYLMNSSASTDSFALSLNKDSLVKVKPTGDGGDAASGLQNTVRVGLARFKDTADVTDDQETIISKTFGKMVDPDGEGGQPAAWVTNKLDDAAIWEPNADKHVDNIVLNNNFLKLKEGEKGDTSPSNGIDVFADGDVLPTYALTKASTLEPKKITDIYDWKTIATAGDPAKPVLAKQIAAQTAEPAAESTISETALKSTADVSNAFSIKGNQITRMRIYVWLEGQDVDCTNYASHGGGITLNLGLSRAVN